MCGISGIVVKSTRFSDAVINERLKKSLNSMAHRGPDAEGIYQRDSLFFGHRRLSIIDLSINANQPMVSKFGGTCISYNGEVYNYKELILEFEIVDLISNSDTELVLELFNRRRENAFGELNGMFAFAIDDVDTEKLFLVRDRFGIKPLYYYSNEDIFAFSSEINSLIELIGFTPAIDISCVHEFLYYGNALGGGTLFSGIRQVLPGEYIEFDLINFESKNKVYWSVQDSFESKSLNIERVSSDEVISKIRELLENSVKSQLVSDVPVGVFLSGGIDSSAITAFASHHYSNLETFSVGFDDPSFKDERPLASMVAKHFNTRHNELFISGLKVQQAIEDLIYHHGMPFSDAANIPLYFMSKEVSSKVKVVLQGDGGDELFGGYRRYSTIQYHRFFHIIASISSFIKLLPNSTLKRRIIRYLNIYGNSELIQIFALLNTDEELDKSLPNIFNDPYNSIIANQDPFIRFKDVNSKISSIKDPGLQLSLTDISIILPDIYLEKVDRSTMAFSIEVRVPFLDNNLFDFMSNIPTSKKVPNGEKKGLLKKALRGIVPDVVLDAPKSGFNVPFKKWLLGPLRNHFFEHLSQFESNNYGVLNRGLIEEWFKATDLNKADYSSRLWKVYQFLIWANMYKIKM